MTFETYCTEYDVLQGWGSPSVFAKTFDWSRHLWFVLLRRDRFFGFETLLDTDEPRPHFPISRALEFGISPLQVAGASTIAIFAGHTLGSLGGAFRTHCTDLNRVLWSAPNGYGATSFDGQTWWFEELYHFSPDSRPASALLRLDGKVSVFPALDTQPRTE